MKYLFSILLIISFGEYSYSQYGADALWLRHACGLVPNGGSTYGEAVSADKFGHVYNAGMMHGYAFTMDTMTYMIGDKSLYLNKYDSTGKRIWTRSFGGPGIPDIQVSRMECDDNGNVYMAGYLFFSASDTVMYFDTIQVSSGGGAAVPGFVAKFNADGIPLWVKTTTSPTSNHKGEVTDMEIVNNEIYICGLNNFYTSYWGSFSLAASSIWSSYVAKLDTSGNVLHAETIDPDAEIYAYGIAASPSTGKIYVTGRFADTLNIDGVTQSYIPGYTNSFIIKYDAGFSADWIRAGYSDGFTSGTITSLKRVEIDHSDNIYLAANGAGNITVFGNLSFNHFTGSLSQYQDIYIVKYNSIGTEQWIRHGGSDKNDNMFDLAVDQYGNSTILIGTGTNTTSGCIFDTIILPTASFSYGGIVKYNSNGALQYAEVIHEGTILRKIKYANDSIFYVTGNRSSSGVAFDTITNVASCEHPSGGGSSYGAKMFLAKFYDELPCIPPAISANITHPVCTGGSGSINVTVTGGIAPYGYSWNTGQTNSSISNLNAGQYTLTVTDDSSCIAVSNFNITDPPPMELNGIISGIQCHGETAVINLSPSGGTPPYTFLWNNNSTASLLTGINAGTYIASVYDINSCVAIDTFIVTEPPPLNITTASSASNAAPNCTGTASVSVNGGTAGYIYSWSNGSTGNNLSNICPGTYFVTVTDANNCISVDSVIVTQSVGLVDLEDLPQVKVYPNPSNGSFRITIPEHEDVLELQIINTIGEVLKHWKEEERTSFIDVSLPNESSGIYHLLVKKRNNVQMIKIILQ